MIIFLFLVIVILNYFFNILLSINEPKLFFTNQIDLVKTEETEEIDNADFFKNLILLNTLKNQYNDLLNKNIELYVEFANLTIKFNILQNYNNVLKVEIKTYSDLYDELLASTDIYYSFINVINYRNCLLRYYILFLIVEKIRIYRESLLLLR